MIKRVIKLDGREEKFDPKKLNNWIKKTVTTIDESEWSQIALEAVKELPEVVNVQELTKSLINTLLARDTWSHYLIAGKLLAVLIRIEVFGSKDIPTVREVQNRLYEAGLMRRLNYGDEEWKIIEETIDHSKDLTYPHYALEQIRNKYSLKNHSNGQEYETCQFVYMRMAMSLFENHVKADDGNGFYHNDPKDRTRIEHVVRIYQHFSNKRLSAPTPNYTNLGTNHKGYASCCIVAANDSRWSLAVGDHITYMMTTQSAGIGYNIQTRSIADSVQKGRFLHRGKKPYIDAFGKNIKANLQGGRGGAGTMYVSLFDPEAKMVLGLRDTRAVDSARNRDAHYAFLTNRFFATKAAKNEEVFDFNVYSAPDLTKAFYSGDIKKFSEIYEKYEKDNKFEKHWFNARDLYLFALNQGVSTGTIYASSIDEMNYNTPFIDPIRSSNLCVAGSTAILTKKGNIPIVNLENDEVEIWNGKEWSKVIVKKTSESSKLIKVELTNEIGQDKRFLLCTEYHKWYIKDPISPSKILEKRTHQLCLNDEIIDFKLPEELETKKYFIRSISDNNIHGATYCVNEPKEHRAVFNGILTGQCLEISEPTEGYDGKDAMKDLYSSEEVGHAHFIAKSYSGIEKEFMVKASDVFGQIGGLSWSAQDVQIGKKFWHQDGGGYEVTNVISVKREPEVALCSLAAINITEPMSDKEYQDVCYYAYKMIDYCILENEYILPHMGVTAKARMNAGLGMMGLATHLARKKYALNSPEGYQEMHRVFERHMYYAIKASLQISKERGNAKWINRTKWKYGWTPIQTYRKDVDKISDFKYNYNWNELSNEIIENGGIAHSCLVTYMPGESSSKALGATNSIYGIRKPILIKTDAGHVIRWAAPYSDDPEYHYQSMWDLTLTEQNNIYAIAQKFTDQSISADWFIDFTHRTQIGSKELLGAEIDRIKKGIKTRYYINTLMPASEDSMKISKSIINNSSVEESEEKCESCTL